MVRVRLTDPNRRSTFLNKFFPTLYVLLRVSVFSSRQNP
uniref:Uncharacterized protein n=1 Tax=Podoviridae sp. cti6G1 TaxID=2826570 RepID=A0A8S5LUC2_9CAUD|nr:MAG TPA: hypothetical protein [Podoviridae sp. cti6G1]